MAQTNLRVRTPDSVLDQILLRVSKVDAIRTRDLLTNALCLAGIGAGKSSAIDKAFRHAVLKGGFGGIVCVAKNEVVDTWIADARACGREHSLIIFDERQGFNFLAHDLARLGADGIGAAVENLMHVLDMCRTATSGGGRTGEAFWQDAARKELRNCLPILHAAYGVLRIKDIIDFIVSAPSDPAQLQDEEWRQSSPMWRAMFAAVKSPVHPMADDEFDSIASYYKDEVARRDPRLRSNVTATISTSLDRFLHGRLNRILCQETTIVPELIFGGAIIILNAPSLSWDADGTIFQQVFKYYTQRAILSRNALSDKHRDRPVFIHADEAQEFYNSFDAPFLSMSRSSLCASIYLTQSLPSIYAKIGGENPKHFGDMLLAQFGLKLFGNNTCPETAKFAAETIGRTLQRRGTFSESESSGRSGGLNMGEGSNFGTNSSVSISPDGKGGFNRSFSSGSSSGYNESTGRNRGFTTGESVSRGLNEVMDYDLEPSVLGRALRTGGPANRGIVDAVLVQAGRRFEATGKNWLVASFHQ